MSFDNKANFCYALIATAPTPAASGTTFSVTAGLGAIFPAAPFNVEVWPAGANPLTTNAEIVRVTNKGTGDNWTVTRTQETSSARSIAVGDQVSLGVTAKTLTDIETQVTTNTSDVSTAIKGLIPGGRLTLTTALPVTTTDVTGASAVTIFYTPYIHNQVPLYDGSTAWTRRTFAEISIAVPATTATMYDVFVYDNSGTAALELLAWTNDTTRATALVKQDGRWVKTGATTRLYLGSFRTGTVSGQTEDSLAKRLVWNFYNRVRRALNVTDATATWTYTTAGYRQANGSTANQVAAVVGVAEGAIDLRVVASATNTGAAPGVLIYVGIGLDGVGAFVTGERTTPANAYTGAMGAPSAHVVFVPSTGYHFYTWMEYSAAAGTTTWNGSTASPFSVSGLYGSVEG
jgi:hypothetical protein